MVTENETMMKKDFGYRTEISIDLTFPAQDLHVSVYDNVSGTGNR